MVSHAAVLAPRDAAYTSDQVNAIMQSVAARASHSSEVVIYGTGSRPVNDYNNPLWSSNFMFWLYPFGAGTPDDPRRRTRSERANVQHLLRMHPECSNPVVLAAYFCVP